MLFPFYELESYPDWIEALENLMYSYEGADRRKIMEIRRVIEKRLRHLWEEFEIPYILLRDTVKLDQVTNIFEKINTKGIPLGVFDLLIARLHSDGIRLKDLLNETFDEYERIRAYSSHYEKLRYYILQALSLAFTKAGSCKRSDILDISRTLKREQTDSFDELWAETTKYVDLALHRIENLRDGFGVKSQRVIPFATMIPIMGALLREIEIRNRPKSCYDKLSWWYWSSVFSNAYSGSIDTTMSSDMKEMKEWFDDDTKIPDTVKLARQEVLGKLRLSEVRVRYGAIYNGVLSLIALKGARDFETGQMLENAPQNDQDHIFPKSRFPPELARSILNITWMSKETNRQLKKAKEPSKYFAELLKVKYDGNESKLLEVLETHYIDSKAYYCLKNNDIEGFTSQRERLLLVKISQLIGAEMPVARELIAPGEKLSNRIAILNAIGECAGYIHWVDKYFGPAGLPMLLEGMDTKNVREVKILSSIVKADLRLRDDFKRFREELKGKGIEAELRVMDAELYRQLHDRWIISENASFNVPSPDVIAQAQYSEIKRTSQRLPFDAWWKNGADILAAWSSIEQEKTKRQEATNA